MSKFGWCLDGHHKDCNKKYHFVLKETQKRGRKTIEVTVVDREKECDCECHKKGR